ncbi:MAG: flavodoxin [Christensenellaceae bacterium]|jgi:flavodoxin I
MNKIAIVYWSGTGNTEAMANGIATGIKESGGEVDVYEVSSISAATLDDYSKIAFGCPSMGDEVLEESEFEPFYASVENSLSGKKVALFGSYGWGDGQWMREWVERAAGVGADLMGEGFIVQEMPDDAECIAYGKQFAAF